MKTSSFLLVYPAGARHVPAMGAALTLAVFVLAGGMPAARAQSGDKSTAKDYVLTRKSTYTPSASPRNPFWPIGWVPTAAVVATPEVAAAAVGPENFIVTSISLDFPPLAVINKRTYGVGDRVPVSAAGALPTGAGTLGAGAGGIAPKSEFVTVRQIADGTVTLDYRGKLMQITTAGPSMTPKK